MERKIEGTIALDDRMLMLFEGNLKRIFALKVSRTTFREVQNVILSCTNQEKQLANILFEMLLTGSIPEHLGNESQQEILEDIVKLFTIPTRLAKEVYERGDFVNIITSDAVNHQQEQFAFVNRVRRIDGDEFTFMTDTESTIHLIQHFVSRLAELEKSPKSKELLSLQKSALNAISDKIKQLTK